MNDDLISRQAAIDAMETWDKFGCGPDGKLVRYDDDKHYIPYVHYEDVVHAIKHLPSARPQRWIPMSERMPENGHYYLWCSYGGNVQSDYYWDGFENGQKYGYTIVAWMPLPEPYKGEQE